MDVMHRISTERFKRAADSNWWEMEPASAQGVALTKRVTPYASQQVPASCQHFASTTCGRVRAHILAQRTINLMGQNMRLLGGGRAGGSHPSLHATVAHTLHS